MDIGFGNRRLAKLFNEERTLRRKYGDRMAETIMRRLAVLKNARTMADVPVTKPERRHELKGDRIGQYAVDLVHPKRLILEPDHDPLPRRPDGGIDPDQIVAVKVVAVVDYHR